MSMDHQPPGREHETHPISVLAKILDLFASRDMNVLVQPRDLKINGYRARGVTSKLRLPGG